LDSLAFTDTLTKKTTAINSALVAAINDTDYYQGFIGVGVAQGRFGKNVTNPFINQLAETYGFIPSHSYGYTAGANYGKSSSISLTRDLNWSLFRALFYPYPRLTGVLVS
jgi:hypothetical protein